MKNILDIIEETHFSILNDIIKKQKYFNENLIGFCANASYLLFLKLQNEGYNPIFCINDFHAFLLLDNKILDITSKQYFGQEHLYLMCEFEKLNKNISTFKNKYGIIENIQQYYEIKEVAHTSLEILNLLEKNGWDKVYLQTPLEFSKNNENYKKMLEVEFLK